VYVCVYLCCQHANEDVEKMILGNKCDMDDKRQVSRERGEAVSPCFIFFAGLLFFAGLCELVSG